MKNIKSPLTTALLAGAFALLVSGCPGIIDPQSKARTGEGTQQPEMTATPAEMQISANPDAKPEASLVAKAKEAIRRISPPENGKPPNDPDNLGMIRAMIAKCEKEGYTREKRYWELREQIAEARLKLAYADTGEKPLSEDEVAKLRAMLPQNKLVGTAKDAAAAAWKEIDISLREAAVPHSWLLVKNRLTSDLADRLARIEFHTGHDLGAAKFKDTLQAIVVRAEEWEVEYGECFFGRREQEVVGDSADAASALATRANALAGRTSRLEAQRAELESQLLAALQNAAPGGPFDTLGIPHRKPLSFDERGVPSDLVFSGLDFGYPYSEKKAPRADPFCYDMLDYAFQGLPMQARGVVADWSTSKLAEARRLAHEDGYFFKQPLTVNSYYRPSKYLDLKFLPEGIDPENPELHLQDFSGNRAADGKPNNTHAYNIWHPEIRSLVFDSLTGAASAAREHIPNLLLFEKLAWEGAALGNFREIYGYNQEALDLFRARLTETYATITALNNHWDTEYASFEEITFPRSPFRQPIFRPSALSYEFQQFRMEEWSGFIADCVRAIQEGAPGILVGTEEPGLTGTFTNGTVPSHRLWKKSPATFFEDHHNNWPANFPALRLHYDLCLYAGKNPIETEWIWTYPRLEQPSNEAEFRITGQLSFWRKMVWGRKILQAFAPFTGWQYHNNLYDEQNSTIHALGLGNHGPFIREAATGLVLGKKRAREFWPVLSSTEVARADIGCLVPTTSMLNEFPYSKLSLEAPIYYRAFARWDALMRGAQHHFRHIPEEAILDGDESLEGFKVLILPYMTYFPEGLADKLIVWVRNGGTLVAEGVPDLFSAHGRTTETLVRAAFGDRLSWQYTGDAGQGTKWSYQLHVESPGQDIETLAGTPVNPALVSTRLGKGQVLVSAKPFGSYSDLSDTAALAGGRGAYEVPLDVRIGGGDEALAAGLFRAIRDAGVKIPAQSKNQGFEMVMRENADGEKFLFVANPSLSESVEDVLLLAETPKRIVDLGLGIELPSKTVGETTELSLRLAPGEATCLALTP